MLFEIDSYRILKLLDTSRYIKDRVKISKLKTCWDNQYDIFRKMQQSYNLCKSPTSNYLINNAISETVIINVCISNIRRPSKMKKYQVPFITTGVLSSLFVIYSSSVSF